MALCDRIKELRKFLGLTQKDFGRKICLQANSVSLIESGRKTSDQTINAICREFNVREEWLRTGAGEMFAPQERNGLDIISEYSQLTERERILIDKFVMLPHNTRRIIIDYIVECADAINGDEDNKQAREAVTPTRSMTAEDLHAELDRQIALEKTVVAKSEVS